MNFSRIRGSSAVRALCAMLGLALAPACAPLPGEELDDSELAADELAGTSDALLLPRFQLLSWDRAGTVPRPEGSQLSADAVALDGRHAFVAFNPSAGLSYVEHYGT